MMNTLTLEQQNIGRLTPRIFVWLLAAQVFGAFLTETKLLPDIPNNVGMFEVTGVVLIASAALYFYKENIPLQTHPVIWLLAAILALAALSQAQVPYERQVFAAVNLAIVLFMLVFVITLYNVMQLRTEHLIYILQFFAWSALISSVWIIVESGMNGGAYGLSGPFRNRAAAGISMLTSFWVVLLYALWPGLSLRWRYQLYLTLLLIIYCIAIAGRRSVYVSLIVGAGMLLGCSALTSGRSTLRIAGILVLVMGAMGGLYFYADDISPAASFYRDRVGLIDDRLEMAAGQGDDAKDNFIVNQRRGVLRAVADHPVTGIGWGGFYESQYSPTGHEVHSTPLRFLAELGVPGFMLYLILMGRLLWGVTYLWWSQRNGLYRLPTLILCAALWSLLTSYVYNRHITERTFWLLLVIIITAESTLKRNYEL